jgi:hypothetical protein
MGRNPTGSKNLAEANPIRMRDLLKNGALKEGRVIKSRITLSGGLQLTLIGSLLKEDSYLDIAYKRTGEAQERLFRIRIVKRTSNLGRGYIYSFECPRTGRRVRALYKPTGSDVWSSSYSYRGVDRIYYPAQRYSKLERATEGYYRLKDRLAQEDDPIKATALKERIARYNRYRIAYLLRSL